MQCKKTCASILLLLASFFTTMAQAPPAFNYQAVARNTSDGSELINTQLQIIAQVRKDSPQGEILYQEDHFDVSTNDYGLFALQIGSGSPSSGNTLAAVPWGNGTYWLVVEIDAGDGFTAVSATQLLSVPFALHANTVENADDADADPANELIDQLEWNNGTLTIGENANVNTLDISDVILSDAYLEGSTLLLTFINISAEPIAVDLSALIDDADPNPANELIESAELFNTTLQLTEGGVEHQVDLASLKLESANIDANEILHLYFAEGTGEITVDLSGLVNDADANPANELNISLVFNNVTRVLTITDAGGAKSVTIPDAVDDADADPTNELIQSVSLADTSLTISEGSNLHSVDLRPFMDSKWNRIEGSDFIYNEADKIAIGNQSPQARLQVSGVDELPTDALISAVTTDGDVAAVVTNNGRMGIKEPTPHSTLQVAGSFAGRVTHRTFSDGNYTIAEDDFLVAVELEGTEPSASAIFITLPPAVSCEGRIYHIKRYGNIPGNDNYINILTSNSDLIDANTSSIQLNENNAELISFISAGVHGWIMLGFTEF